MSAGLATPLATETWRRLSTAFYARVKHDPVLRPLFPGKSFQCAIEELTAFLSQFFGGPAEDTQRRWWLSLRESHARFRIGPEERSAWLKNMSLAFDDVGLDERARGALEAFFLHSSEYIVNGAGIGMPAELACRWDSQVALEEAVAAIRKGDAEGAIGIVEGAALRNRLEGEPGILVGLLGAMIGSGDESMLRYCRERVEVNPALTRERYAGRTLLHEASAKGDLATMELLLRVGADANAKDGGNHTPLYSVANQYGGNGGDVVRALLEAGADVNARDGVKRCTPLHMAARRGNVEIASALLDCGAELELRDIAGETALRRAVNCGKVSLAAVLLKRGADRHSPGSKGLTAMQAARSTAMKKLFA